MKNTFTILFALFVLLIINSSLIIDNCKAQSGWFPLNSGTGENLFAAYFNNDNTGYIGGNNSTVLKTTNAGLNWSLQTLPATNSIRAIVFTDFNTGYLAGASPVNGNIYKTTNAGITWNVLTLPIYNQLYSIYFINTNTGFASGSKTILKTTNAGSTWESQSFPSLNIIYSICFTDPQIGYAAEYNTNGKILKTTNAGINWQEIYTSNGWLWGITFIDANTGMAVGGNGSAIGSAFILRTTNGGINWSNCLVNNSDIYNFWSIRFVTPSVGYIAGRTNGGGKILKTTNAGVNWYFQTFNANAMLTGNYFTSIDTGYVVGYYGVIYKTTDGGGNMTVINSDKNQIPAKFSLFQNYPNPFNPTTKIKYDVQRLGNVKIVVYGVMGHEVQILVNKSLKPGTYEVSFDGSHYSSGVYFYKLITDGFTETKKMLMLK